jgi:D-alanine transfer protein
MMKKIGLFHIIPLIIACLLFYVSYQFIILNLIDDNVKTSISKNIIISGKQTKISGRHGRLIDGDSLELDFIASIKNEKQLTLMGSSEFSEKPIVPYNYFPERMGRQAMGLGHAHHQSLSILIELLAAHPENLGSKVIFFISPGWFDTHGTNSEAFVEFARPNFLNRIANDTTINKMYKIHIGKYIDLRYAEFEGVSNSMDYFRNLYLNSKKSKLSISLIDTFIKNHFSGNKSKQTFPKVNYDIELTYMDEIPYTQNFDSIAKALQKEFLNNITNNKLYVNDEYYTQYLIDENNEERFVILDKPEIANNLEYQDFKMLVEYVTERKMNASFVIIPFNPYYYRNTEIYLPLIDSLTTILDQNNLPYKNMYVSDTSQYEPGTLKDVMHFGNFGWMQVNKYIDSLYYGNN